MLRFPRQTLALVLGFAVLAAFFPRPSRAAEGLPVEVPAASAYSLTAWAGALDTLRAGLARTPDSPSVLALQRIASDSQDLAAVAAALQSRGLSPQDLSSLASAPAPRQERVLGLLSQASASAAPSGGHAAALVSEEIAQGAAALERAEQAQAPDTPAAQRPPLYASLPRSSDAVELSHFRAKLLADNEESLRENISVLDQAKTKAAVSTLIWRDDEAGRALAYAVLRAVRRGVRVTLIVDAFHMKAGDRRQLAILSRAGADVRIFRPLLARPLKAHKRMHDKAVWADAADGKVLFLVGGRNKADRYLRGDGLFDVDARLTVDSKTGADLYRSQFEPFLRTKDAAPWRPPAREPPASPREYAAMAAAYRRAVEAPSAPAEPDVPVAWGLYVSNRGRRPDATRLIESLIATARRSVLMANAYFIPNARQRALLARKLSEGVAVSVYSNSRASTIHRCVVRMMEGVVRRLVAAGLSLRQHLGGELHAKTTMTDGRYLFVSSTNLDPRSERLDTQNGVLLDSPELAARFKAAVDARASKGRFQDFKGPRGWNLIDAVIRLLLEPAKWLL